MIRGTSMRLNERAQRASITARVQSPTVGLRRAGRARASRSTTTRMKPVRVSIAKPMTLPELISSLESWEDPSTDAHDLTAKERIIDCFEQQSDSLDLSYLLLTTLPDAVGRLQHVQFLSIANNYFSEIPACLTRLTALRLLNVSNNVLEEVPDSIKQFAKLEFLNAASNQLCRVSDELGRLAKIETVILSHNRILEFPENIHRIDALEIDDQVAPASFEDFSVEFAQLWKDAVRNEGGAGNWEIWVARFQQILEQPNVELIAGELRERIGMLMNAMARSVSLRQQCFDEAVSVVATCYEGILFSLFVMEIRHIEEQISTWQLEDNEVRKQVERIFNFHELQQRAVRYAAEDNDGSDDGESEMKALEASVCFYLSPANTLEMPLEDRKLRCTWKGTWTKASHQKICRVVWQIEDEKHELGEDYLADFVMDKEFWIGYLAVRYAKIIDEHTQIFMEQLDQLETRKHLICEYDYLTQSNALVEEKTDSERRLYRQLTRNIVAD